ncbi:MAG: twin-arginine translocation signal domain-containing protein [Planctomycetota bacterium]|jgi:hypothetical protein
MKNNRRDFLKAIAVLGVTSGQLIKAGKGRARLGRDGQPEMAGEGKTQHKRTRITAAFW